MRLASLLLVALLAACASAPADEDQTATGLEVTASMAQAENAVRETEGLIDIFILNSGDQLVTVEAISLDPPLTPPVTTVRREIEPGRSEKISIWASDRDHTGALRGMTHVSVNFTVGGKRMMKRYLVEVH